MSSSFAIFGPKEDFRTPLIPGDSYAQAHIKNRGIDYPVVHRLFSCRHKTIWVEENYFLSKQVVKKDGKVVQKDGKDVMEDIPKIVIGNQLMHMLQKIELTMVESIHVHHAALLITKEISLSANVIQIEDDGKTNAASSDKSANSLELKRLPLLKKSPKIEMVNPSNGQSPLRTTLVAREKLTIKASTLIIDGADIIKPAEHSITVKTFCYRNTSYNTRWLQELYPSTTEKRSDQPLRKTPSD